MSDKPYIQYIGRGDALPNIPARDMTKSEFLAFDHDTRALILASGLYLVNEKGK